MLIQVCILSIGIHAGSKIYKKIKQRIKSNPSENNFIVNYKKKLHKISKKIDANCQKFVQDKIDPLFADLRGQQLKDLPLKNEPTELSKEEKNSNIHLVFASANMGLAIFSKIFYPPFILACLPVILYFTTDFFKDAYFSLVKKRRFSISVLDCIFIIWALSSGYILAAAIGSFLFSFFRKLLLKTKEFSQKKLMKVFDQHIAFVWILVEDKEIEIPFKQLQTGDVVIVNAGEIIPADGTIIEGIASIDQHILTGEFKPVEKGIDEQVFASTYVLSGRICFIAEKAGKETISANIFEILNNTTNHKTLFESKTEKIVDYSSLPTLALSLLAFTVSGSRGALAILNTGMGYSMRVLGPLSTLNFLRIASQNGILIKNGIAMEKLAKVDTIIFDKTGTLTTEQPDVKKIYTCNDLSRDTLLAYAAAAEHRQTHPVARAIISAAEKQKLTIPDIEDTCYEIGYGIRVKISEQLVRVGSQRFMEMENIFIPENIKAIHKQCGIQGYSLIMVSIDNELAGAIELHPKIRLGAKQLIDYLKKIEIKTYIISGDHEQPTRILAKKLKIDKYFADTLPEQKAFIVEQLQNKGETVCFIGDGINDSIALMKADISISLRGASTAAIDSADIIFMDKNLDYLTRLIKIVRDFEANQKRNVGIAFIPGVICIGGVFLLHFGLYRSMVLYYGSLLVGVGNASYPIVINKNVKEKT